MQVLMPWIHGVLLKLIAFLVFGMPSKPTMSLRSTMRYTCYHDSMHLLTCSLCQVTMAKYSRCRLLYSGREVQQPMDWKCTWYYVEIANGERGFTHYRTSSTS